MMMMMDLDRSGEKTNLIMKLNFYFLGTEANKVALGSLVQNICLNLSKSNYIPIIIKNGRLATQHNYCKRHASG